MSTATLLPPTLDIAGRLRCIAIVGLAGGLLIEPSGRLQCNRVLGEAEVPVLK
jgi:hypothetical protein